MNPLKNIINFIKGKGFKITITKPWPGEKKLKKVYHGYVERTDPLNDIAKRKKDNFKIRRLIKCYKCGEVVHEDEAFRCEKCFNIFCKNCSAYKDYPVCKNCNNIDKGLGGENYGPENDIF